MSLELANRCIQYPRGIAEDVLIKIDKFVLLIDFVIQDMRENSRILIILERPFLATARAMIDVFNKKITLRVRSKEVIFDVNQSIKKPRTEDDECYGIDNLDTVIQSTTQELLENDQLNENLEEGISQHDFEKYDYDSKTLIRRFFQILFAPKDQEKTTFTCPYGTFAYRRMTLGLCNALATFQRYMTAIFHDMVEDFMEVFKDDFSVFGFDIEIKDKKGAKNLAADHLSRLKNPNMGELAEEEIEDKFPDEHLMILKTKLNEEEPR
ncbi:reverse transcriptase domain-containing protein [Tanacetum coccineum]